MQRVLARFTLPALTLLTAGGIAVSATAQSGPPATVIVAPAAPPPPRVETMPPMPTDAPAASWMPGHWAWSGTNWAWVDGQYVPRPQPTARWEPGHWAPQTAGGYVWVDGRWVS
jgi:hypothetical protein